MKLLATTIALLLLVGCAGIRYERKYTRADGTTATEVVTPHVIPGTDTVVFETTAPKGGVDWWAVGENALLLLIGGPTAVLGVGALKSQRVRTSLAKGHVQTALGWKHSSKQDHKDEGAATRADA